MKKTTLKLLAKWEGTVFESSSQKTPEFKSFARDFKKMLKAEIEPEFEITEYNVGHFYVSSYLTNKESGKIVYLSVSDVRHFNDEWYQSILIRSAESVKDSRGGMNNYTYLANIKDNLIKLVERERVSK